MTEISADVFAGVLRYGIEHQFKPMPGGVFSVTAAATGQRFHVQVTEIETGEDWPATWEEGLEQVTSCSGCDLQLRIQSGQFCHPEPWCIPWISGQVTRPGWP